jgi:hypothetical protein
MSRASYLAPWAARAKRRLVGAHGLALLFLALPTLLAITIDLALRARALAGHAPQGKLIYLSSWLISAAFWAWPLWLLCRLWSARARTPQGAQGQRVAGVGIVALSALWLLPFATFCYAGQPLYYRVFHAYVGRDTVRLGIALRGTVSEWFGSWGGPWVVVGMLVIGGLVTGAMLVLTRRIAVRVSGSVPLLLPLTFVGAFIVMWVDLVDSRFLQAATPDACFVHGLVHALRVSVTGKGGIHQGMTVRTPAALPPLMSARARPPSVLLILTESVRADATCSDPPPSCVSPFLDMVVPDRIALGELVTETPSTFSAFLLLTTGLVPNVDFRSAHTAPVLWEIARAVGYETAYISAQNPKYEDFGAFTERAGIDVLITGSDLGGLRQEQLGAPDERATEETLRFVRSVPADRPYFAVMHLSNTHAPYRTDPALLPFVPESTNPLGDRDSFHNHYRNAVRLQERTVAGFLRSVRALPGWDDTVVLFLSDHGEQFFEHGGLYHNHSIWQEELRIPGWIAAGAHALRDDQREALQSYAGRRTFTPDVHATVVDLFGVDPGRSDLPLASMVRGRSLLRSYSERDEKPTLLTTSTAVWEPDDAWFGAMLRDRKLVGALSGPWRCFDTKSDPDEREELGEGSCADLVPVANAAFGVARAAAGAR